MFAFQLDPALSPTGAAQQEAQPRLFDEFNDDGDDDDAYGYGAVGGGKSDGLKVILVAPNRSPAMPPARAAASGCCGGPTTHTSATAKDESKAGATVEDGDGGATAVKHPVPVPVLVGGWAGAGAVGSYWKARGHSADAKREEETHAQRAAAAAAAEEEGGEGLLDEGQTVCSGTEVSR